MIRGFGNIDNAGKYVADGTAAIAAVSTSAAASTASVLGTILNVGKFDELVINFTASLALNGGNCDYVIERLMPDGTWDDYLYLGRQTGNGATAFSANAALPTELGPTDEAAGGATQMWIPHTTFGDATIALTAGKGRNGHHGNSIRVVARTLAGVSVAAVTNTYIRGVQYA